MTLEFFESLSLDFINLPAAEMLALCTCVQFTNFGILYWTSGWPPTPPKIIVVGAGVNGLSTAVCLQLCCPEADIEIVAEKFSPNTTSDGSGGYWEPYAMGDTDTDKVMHLSRVTYDYLMDLVCSPIAGDVGAQRLSGYSLIDEELEEDRIFKDVVDGYRRLTPRELERFPMAKCGYFHTTIQLEVTPYLQWLMERFKKRGGKVRMAKLSSLNELAGTCDLVVNCCGIGAKELLNDNKIVPIRGQLWRVHAPWIKHFYIFSPKVGFDFTYIIPGLNNVVVGGTSQVGDWRTELDEGNSQSIWKAATAVLPSLSKAVPIKSWVGLRPTRSAVRMETEVIDAGGQKLKVVHNYGHGGSGITIHWGCAIETVDLAMKALGKSDINVQQILKSRL